MTKRGEKLREMQHKAWGGVMKGGVKYVREVKVIRLEEKKGIYTYFQVI